MPLYDYQCTQCQHTFEVLHAREANGPNECPLCQAASPKRQMSSGHFHLKGGGWYVTDIKDKNKKSGDKTAATDTGNGSKTASETGDASTPSPSKTTDAAPSGTQNTTKDNSD